MTDLNQLILERAIKDYFKRLIDADPDELDLTEIAANVLAIIRKHS